MLGGISMARTFKIFYSWQSDLPGKDTRNFISDAIDAAVNFLANTVKVIPDRDTKDTTGSPNIEETIFNKINECDLFIGDLSIVTSYKSRDGEIKYTPNPNVLIELGYAVRVLGWENVICFVNTDFGKEANLPFDLNHHRVTGYSLQNKERADIRKRLRDVISSTVMTLMENGVRPKEGFASHMIGAYDFKTKRVSEKLIPFNIQNCGFAKNYKEYLLREIKENIEAALSIKLPNTVETATNNSHNVKDSMEDSKILDVKGRKYKISSMQKFDLIQYQKVEISDEKQVELQNNVKEFLGIDLDEDFFNLGDLKVTTGTVAELVGFEQKGSDEAKKKFYYIQEIIHKLKKLTLFNAYLKTFDGMLFFPLAIWNKTTTTDEDINVFVVVDEDTAEIIVPDEKLIAENMVKKVGLIYKEQFIEMLLKMPDTSDIVDGSDYAPQTSAELRTQIAHNAPALFGYSQELEYDIDDYVDEIQKYIASPIDTSFNEFDFHNRKLRPNEKNWLGKGILLRPKASTIIMTYKITSEHSDGSLEGVLKFEF